MRMLFGVDPEMTDFSPVTLSVHDVHEVDLNAEARWDLSDIPPSRKNLYSLGLAGGFYRHSRQVRRVFG